MAGSNGYEKRDVKVWKVALAVLGTGAFVIISPIVLYQYFVHTKEAIYFERVLRPVAPDLLETKNQEKEQLTSYGVVSQNPEVYRLPIDRAMELMLREAKSGSKPTP